MKVFAMKVFPDEVLPNEVPPNEVLPTAVQFADEGDGLQILPRHVAPGGVKRLLVGFACGVVAGALVALVLPRDDGSPGLPRASGRG